MKTLNIPFDNAEYSKLEKAKGERTWHDFVLLLINIKVKKNGDKHEL